MIFLRKSELLRGEKGKGLRSVHVRRGGTGGSAPPDQPCAAPLLIWVNVVLMDEARAAHQNQSGFQLIKAVGTKSGFPSLSSSLVAGGAQRSGRNPLTSPSLNSYSTLHLVNKQE